MANQIAQIAYTVEQFFAYLRSIARSDSQKRLAVGAASVGSC